MVGAWMLKLMLKLTEFPHSWYAVMRFVTALVNFYAVDVVDCDELWLSCHSWCDSCARYHRGVLARSVTAVIVVCCVWPATT